jgi:hypothetical protein
LFVVQPLYCSLEEYGRNDFERGKREVAVWRENGRGRGEVKR